MTLVKMSVVAYIQENTFVNSWKPLTASPLNLLDVVTNTNMTPLVGVAPVQTHVFLSHS